MAFSKSGFWLDWKRDGIDPAASLLQAYTRILAEARPALLHPRERVCAHFQQQGEPTGIHALVERDRVCWIQVRLEGSQRCGLRRPAARPRLFIVGARKREKLPELPEATHHGQWERRKSEGGPLPHMTTGQALADLVTEPEREEVVRGRWGHLLPEIPPGGNYLHFTEKLGHPDPIFEWRSRYWSFLLKLDPDRPAPTIQAQPGPNVGPFHWEGRRLRIPELRRLFTFPDEYAFVGKRISVQSQIGNSVPPLLAQRRR